MWMLCVFSSREFVLDTWKGKMRQGLFSCFHSANLKFNKSLVAKQLAVL